MSPLDLQFLRRLVREKAAERSQRILLWSLAALSVLCLLYAFYILYCRAPKEFHARTIITVRNNSGLNEIAQTLAEQKVIKSPFWFRALVILMSGQAGVQAGDYYFEKPAGIFGVSSRLTHGAFGLTPVRVTFPEGMTVTQMATILRDQLIDFDSEAFIRSAKPKEGYLFPDTYLFLPNANPQTIVSTLENNFDAKIKTIDGAIKSFKKPLKDVVVMASILEAEARTTETRETISGILWKRLGLGMPLQVDAPFQYIIGKNTFQLTLDDLKFDSPYNTYKYKGLPPTAIGNPGIDALTAAVTPTKSPYFFYLSDVRGNMHYTKTYEEHLANKERYLK